jgi:hypothetical protein
MIYRTSIYERVRILGKPHQTHIKLDTTKHFRAPEREEMQTTHRDTLIHENVLKFRQELRICHLLAWVCSHPQCLVQELRMAG